MGKIFDKLITSHQNSSDFSPVKFLRYVYDISGLFPYFKNIMKGSLP